MCRKREKKDMLKRNKNILKLRKKIKATRKSYRIDIDGVKISNREMLDLESYLDIIEENGSYLGEEIRPRGPILEILFRNSLMEKETRKKDYNFLDGVINE